MSFVHGLECKLLGECQLIGHCSSFFISLQWERSTSSPTHQCWPLTRGQGYQSGVGGWSPIDGFLTGWATCISILVLTTLTFHVHMSRSSSYIQQLWIQVASFLAVFPCWVFHFIIPIVTRCPQLSLSFLITWPKHVAWCISVDLFHEWEVMLCLLFVAFFLLISPLSMRFFVFS